MVAACGKWRQEDQKFKVLLSDKMSLRLAWATQDGGWLAGFALTGLDAVMSVCKIMRAVFDTHHLHLCVIPGVQSPVPQGGSWYAS